MTEHDNPFAEATQRLSHTGYALASLAEQHTRRAATRTHAQAADLEKPREQNPGAVREEKSDRDSERRGRGGSPNNPTALASKEHTEDLIHAVTDTAAMFRESVLATDKTAAALAQETYPHAMKGASAPDGRTSVPPVESRSLQPVVRSRPVPCR